MSKFKKAISFVLLFALILPGIALADSAEDDRIVVLGKNLNENQRSAMLREFNVDSDVKIIEVTNDEERHYLGKYIDSKQLGTRAISSAYVERLREGEGIQVESNNITWVTDDMYRNALLTAGVHDARVKISSPVAVSGTAALTGIMKAFEDLSGEKIPEKEKEVASEEIAKTAILGNEIGKKEAEELISSIKIYIINNNITSESSIKDAIDKMAGDLEITLTEKQKAEITELMKKISKLDINVESIKSQIGDIASKINDLTSQNEEIRGILQKILDAITNFFNKIFN